MQAFKGFWTAPRMTAVHLLALLAPMVEQLLRHGFSVVQNLLLAIAITMGWQTLFAILRKRPITVDGLMTATLFTILIAPATPWSRIAIALSFGVVIGEQIFGGRGRNFINPVVVALAFLFFSFPETDQQPLTMTALAIVPGGILMTMSGLVSLRVLVAALFGYLAMLAVFGTPIATALLTPGLILFGIVFLVGDAVCAAATCAGRWVYGFLAGALFVLLSPAPGQGTSVDAVVFAALLASVFAPLIDQAAITFSVWRQRHHYG